MSSRINAENSRVRKIALGQFLTSKSIAQYMASLFSSQFEEVISLLDAGAGNGILSAAFLGRWLQESEKNAVAQVTTYEIDEIIISELSSTIDAYKLKASNVSRKLITNIIQNDFIEDACNLLQLSEDGMFTHAILNPPYKKISSSSNHRQMLRTVGVETVNLYSAFVALSILLLRPRGEIVAIIPRSFCSGPYYRAFRQLLLQHVSLRHIHLFESRNKVFGTDGVLQENVIIHLIRDNQTPTVSISTSYDSSFEDYECRQVPFEEIVKSQDVEQIIHIPTVHFKQHNNRLSVAKYTLAELDLKVSTGPVVDFRLKEYLRYSQDESTVPLVYPSYLIKYRLQHPTVGGKKPNAIIRNSETEKWLFPNECYVLVRRFSSKEEKRRISATVMLSEDLSAEMVGFENHLNVFHCGRRGIDKDLAFGLAAYLNSTDIDVYFRQFNGHTQVNAGDLRSLPYPSLELLKTIGRQVQAVNELNQIVIDTIVNGSL